MWCTLAIGTTLVSELTYFGTSEVNNVAKVVLHNENTKLVCPCSKFNALKNSEGGRVPHINKGKIYTPSSKNVDIYVQLLS